LRSAGTLPWSNHWACDTRPRLAINLESSQKQCSRCPPRISSHIPGPPLQQNPILATSSHLQYPSRTSKSRHHEISAHYYIPVQPTASTVESNHPALILCYLGTHGTRPLRRHIPLIPRDMCVYPPTLSGLNYQFATNSNIWGRCSLGAVRWLVLHQLTPC
jgi:hypothetical protein